MKNKTYLHILQGTAVLLVIAALLVGFIAPPQAEAVRQTPAFSINKLDGLEVNYKDYFDGSVIYQLPAGIRDDEEISVIITLGKSI